MSNIKTKVLVLTERPDLFGQVQAMLAGKNDLALHSESTAAARLNGRFPEMVGRNDVLIFDASPDKPEEIEALEKALRGHEEDAVFLALADNDITLADARRLREIGVDDVLPISIDGDALAKAIADNLKRLRPHEDAAGGAGGQCVVLPVVQARGGVGGTTIAVNLACALAAKSGLLRGKGSKVALLDFDIQFGNANVFLDIEEKGGFLQLLDSHEEPDAKFAREIMQHHSATGVDVLCAPSTVIPVTAPSPRQIASYLAVLQHEYDYIVLDFPRALVDWISPVLEVATRMVMVMDTSVPSVRHARRLIDFFREDLVALPVDLIVNREMRPLIKSHHVKEAEKVLEAKLLHWIPDDPKVARAAVDLGRPVVEMKPGSPMGKAISRYAKGIAASHHLRGSAPA